MVDKIRQAGKKYVPPELRPGLPSTLAMKF